MNSILPSTPDTQDEPRQVRSICPICRTEVPAPSRTSEGGWPGWLMADFECPAGHEYVLEWEEIP